MIRINERQRQVLEGLEKYKLYSEIGEELGVTREYVRIIAKRLKDKMPENDPRYSLLSKNPRERRDELIKRTLESLSPELRYSGSAKTAHEEITEKLPFPICITKLYDVAADLGVIFYKESQEKKPLTIGDVFGFWKVKSRVPREPKSDAVFYFCECLLCHQTFRVRKNFLLDGRSQSCGSCAAKQRWKKIKGEVAA